MESDQLKILTDIRTLIVHSGEQLTDIHFSELEGYKDSQLGRIVSAAESKDTLNSIFFRKYPEMNYYISIWQDKRDTTKKLHLSEVDYHHKNESYKDIKIYVAASDVRNIMLNYIQTLIEGSKNEEKISSKRKHYPQEKHIFDKEKHEIDFEKIVTIISKDTRGGYFIENDIHYWSGYGLKYLYEYVKEYITPGETKSFILEKIETTMKIYWEAYTHHEELPSLNIIDVFSDWTPQIARKSYFENEKLFERIAPFFHAKEQFDATDIGYLAEFINELHEVGMNLDINTNVDNFICEYIIQSVEVNALKKP